MTVRTIMPLEPSKNFTFLANFQNAGTDGPILGQMDDLAMTMLVGHATFAPCLSYGHVFSL